jgi:predicted RNA-binding protein with PUA-like domain
MPSKWLFKSDPGAYSFTDLERDGETVWDGVSNNLALKHLRSVQRGDEVLIYHSGNERAVVGVAEALSPSYPDPKRNDPRLVVVNLAAKKRLQRPVTLDAIRARPNLRTFDLVRLPRLSVMPVTGSQWNEILSIAGESAGESRAARAGKKGPKTGQSGEQTQNWR